MVIAFPRSAIKHFTTSPIKKFQQFNPRFRGGGLNQYRLARDWIVPRQSRHFAATRVEFCGFCATGYTLLLAKFLPKGLVRSDRVKRKQKWTILVQIRRISNFTNPSPRLSLNELRLRRLRWLPLVFFFFLSFLFSKSRFAFSSGKEKWLLISFQLCNRRSNDILIYSMISLF